MPALNLLLRETGDKIIMGELNKWYIEKNMQEAINAQLEWCKDPMYLCGIYSSTRSYLDELFNSIINSVVDVNEIRTITISNNMHSKKILFENGSVMFFRIVKNSINSGIVNGAIIDSLISNEILNTIILPKIRGDYEHIIVVNPSSASTGGNNEEEDT